MHSPLSLTLGALALIFVVTAYAGPREYVFQNERVCDQEKVFCIQGTLTYESNPRLLILRARIKRAPGPGMLRLLLVGANRKGDERFAPFEVRVRGKDSEIINHKMIPDYPDTESWAVYRIEFIADAAQ